MSVMAEYKPGQLSAFMSKGKVQKAEGTNKLVAKLFSKKKQKAVEIKTETPPEPISDKKNNITDNSAANKSEVVPIAGSKRKADTPDKKEKKKKKKSAENSITQPNDFPYMHESLQKEQIAQKKTSSAQKKKKKVQKDDDDDGAKLSNLTRTGKVKRDKTADSRTIFVGNCPLSADKKMMLKLFKPFGAIESIRFRCGPAAQLDLPRRAIMIKKEFHENAKSFVSYIVFKEEESAHKALKLNGHLLEDQHLRVDLASSHKKTDKKRSIFIGNLPFSVLEEDLRSHFEDCGAITNVRVVRDRQTSIGKGIAYIQFESKDGVTLAKKLNESEFEGRKLRVMTCTNKQVNTTDKSKSKTDSRKSIQQSPHIHPAQRRISFAPSNRKPSKSFHDILKDKKEKRKLKKKKKLSVKRSDGLSSIFGDVQGDMNKLESENPKIKKKNKVRDSKGGKSKKDKQMKKDKKAKKENSAKKTKKSKA